MCLDIYAAEQNGKNVWQTPDTKTACLAETLYIGSFKYRRFDFRPVYGQWHNRRGRLKYGRKFCGCEQETEFFELAKKRLENGFQYCME